MAFPYPFARDLSALQLAPALLGSLLWVRGMGAIIIETEAYMADDPASHSFRGPNARNGAMFGAAGDAYIYRIYGIHLCLNVVARPGEAVLLRAVAPCFGLGQMRRNRPQGPLGAGPGRLCQALGLTMDDNGRPFGSPDFALLRPSPPPADFGPVLCGPRIGITKARTRLWRFGIPGAAPLSRPFPPL